MDKLILTYQYLLINCDQLGMENMGTFVVSLQLFWKFETILKSKFIQN